MKDINNLSHSKKRCQHLVLQRSAAPQVFLRSKNTERWYLRQNIVEGKYIERSKQILGKYFENYASEKM